MRKVLMIAVMVLMLSIGMTAQNKYYYYNGSKIPLVEQNGKTVLISQGNTIARGYENNVIQTIDDKQFNIQVVERSSISTNMTKGKSFINCHIESCYKNMSGLELIPTGYINIELKQSTDYDLLQELASVYNLVIVGQNDFMPLWYSLRLENNNDGSVIDIANAIYESGMVSSCSPDFSFDGIEISYDPDVLKQWGLYNSRNEGIDISASLAWTYSTGYGIKIAIVDQGVEVSHQDLAQNIYMSYDCTKKTSPTATYGDHGTHCAGIAAAVRNNGIQVSGVAPDAKIMAAGVNFSSSNAISGLADGINWAWQNGADVISCSWTCGENDMIKRAIDNAVTKGREGKGCVFVKSAGNSNGDITFPGAYRKEVIAVASLKIYGNRRSDSCFGDNLLVCAPGDSILSTVNNNRVGYKGGTSMACPHVAGVAALILSRNPALSALKVREIIAKSTKQVGDKPYVTTKEFGKWNKWYGYGLIDAYEAVINTPRN